MFRIKYYFKELPNALIHLLHSIVFWFVNVTDTRDIFFPESSKQFSLLYGTDFNTPEYGDGLQKYLDLEKKEFKEIFTKPWKFI